MKKKCTLKNKILIFVIVLSIVGIVLSSILTLAKYNDSIALLCGEDLNNNCNTVQNSEYSNLFTIEDEQTNTQTSVPITLAGLVYYIILLVLGVMIFRNEKVTDKKKKKNLDKQMNKFYLIMFILSIFGLLFSIVYTLIQAFVIKAYCTYCLISAFDSLLLFVGISYLYFKR